MLQQASFYGAQFPAAFSSRAEVSEVLAYLSSSEWTQLTAWFAEGKSIQAVATAIDTSWPAK
jgi:hypothetical protein